MNIPAIAPDGLAQERPAGGLLGLAERGRIPDALVRLGIRRLCARRLREERAGGLECQAARHAARIEMLRRSPVAIHTDAANAQHYELPPAFFELCLGRRLKYSSCYYPRGDESLDEAEEAMLALYCERAELADGQQILELGCGWGSLTLWMAERYPCADIVAVSNSNRQREHIEARCRERGLSNVRVLTKDVNRLDLDAAQFDRCVSIEMFEHMRNWHELLRRISTWLVEDGKAFVHVFSHRTLPYLFQSTWAAERFFTAGLMPSHDLLPRFQEHLVLADRWVESGSHYAKTLRAWLARLDAHSDEALELLIADGRSRREARTLLGCWRLFLLSTEEIWSYRGGDHWLVSHYLLEPRSS